MKKTDHLHQERQGDEDYLNHKDELKRVPATWSKRMLKILITIIIPLIVLYGLVTIIPYFIVPEITTALKSKIESIWGISSIIQYCIYAAIAFYFYPRMASRKRLEVAQELQEIERIMASPERSEFSEREHFEIQRDHTCFQRKLMRIDQLTHLKVQWVLMGILIVFDMLAGQLPYWLIIHQ